jgi:hypothetical protein
VRAQRRWQRAICLVAVAVAAGACLPAVAQAGFGIQSFSAAALNEGGGVDLRAGAHPYQYKFALKLNQDSEERPEGTISTLTLDLPAGTVGNPLAVPRRCSGAAFEGIFPHCPANTAVGVAYFKIRGIEGDGPEGSSAAPVYNLTPPLGVVASVGFSVINENSFQEASLRSGDYGVRAADLTIPTEFEITAVTEIIWGVPGDPSHNGLRGPCLEEGGSCPFDAEGKSIKPFLTLPTSCGGPLQTTVAVTSVQEPGFPQSASVLSEDDAGPIGLHGCNELKFKPDISSQPTTNLADSPSGLDFNINLPQNEELDEELEGRSTAHLKDVKVTLPAGMTVNAAAGNGLGACTEAQIGYQPAGGKIQFSGAPQSCPNAAKVGTLKARAPAVDHEVNGSIYLAKPFQNPFGSLMAIYLAVEDEQTGINIKLAGKVEADAKSGQLTTRFAENPQLPIEDIEAKFFDGPRAPLKTPLTCGTKTTSAVLTPWSTPEGADVTATDSFETSVAPGGGSCPTSEAEVPSNLAFSAGTLAPEAGVYSPFVLKLSRPDGSQPIGGLNTTLPKGLTAKLTGVPYCSEAQIAAAKAREVPNAGTLEQASPSCPLASEVGTVTAGAGAGTAPLYVTGHAYLAGPYKGAPLSLAIITPAVAGPFDLGAVVVRAALFVDSETGQASAVSDPLPSVINGIPLDLRSVAVNLSRPDFTLNPTSCNAMAVLGWVPSPIGQASLSAPFQVGGCKGLKFAPKIELSLKGGTRRTKHPALRAVVTYPKGRYANIKKAQVTLPHSEFIDQAHIRTICTRVQFAAGGGNGEQCPKGSVYGFARAFTPLLDKPLEGPVYLRSSSHELPDTVAALSGQVDVAVVGRVDTGKGGGIRNTIEAAPDAPVSKFVLEMKGGKKGLFVNSENICKKPQRAIVHFSAHNGKFTNTNPLIKNSCGGKGKKHKKG